MPSIRSGNPHQLMEITTRTDGARLRLVPNEKTTKIILGCLGRAKHIHPVEIHAFVFMSNHYHVLASAKDARRMSLFMGHLNGNIAREINREFGEDGHLWHRRFSAIPIADQDEAQIARLRYVLAHGVKERLVARCQDWPGASSLPWMLEGRAIKGVWHNRTDEYRARRKQDYVENHADFEIEYPIEISPLPCWRDVEESVWREWVAEIVAEIEVEEKALRTIKGRDRGVMGSKKILCQNRNRRPKRRKRSRAPLVHCVGSKERKRWHNHFRDLRQAYGEASKCFRDGEYDVEFPVGTFRPHGRFVDWPSQSVAV